MKSTIRRLYLGINADSIKYTKKYDKLLDKAIESDNVLRAKLSLTSGLLELYEKANNAIELLNEETAAMHFTESFKIGVLLGLELTHE